MSKTRPNIIQITCHDLGRHLGCYGVDTVRTPNLDALAASGVRFTRVFCTAPQCSPSRSSLATGRFPHANGVMGLTHQRFGWDLFPNERPIAMQLGDAGYETHLFGFQHVSPRVERLGFQHIHQEGPATDIATAVQTFLTHAEQSDQPRYLEINLREPHRPYDQGGIKPDDSRGVSVPAYLPDTDAAREEFAALQGAIHTADQAVGIIVAALDQSTFADNTLLLFTTDHGIAMPRAKCTLYDPGIGIALLIRWSAIARPAGSTIDTLMSNVDIFPTLLEAARISVPANIHGRSVLPLLLNQSYSPQQEAIFAEKTFHSYYDPMRAIRTDRYKFIRNFASAFLVEVPGDIQVGSIYRTELQRYISGHHPAVELYDLETDPLEQNNLAGRIETESIERELDRRLWEWMKSTGDPLLNGPIASPAYRTSMDSSQH